MRRILLFWTFVVCSLTGHTCELKASWEPWEPYQFQDASGKITGLDNDLLTAVAKEAGCTVKLSNTPWKRTLQMLEDGSLHIAGGASKTPEREAFAHFTDSYREETMVMYVQKSKLSAMNFDTLEALAASGESVGIARGYFYGDTFDNLRKADKFKGTVSEVVSDEQNLKKLIAGRLGGVLVDRFVGASLVRQLNASADLVEHPVKINSDAIYFMVSKKGSSMEVVNKINQALGSLRSSGKYDEIVKRYLN